MYIIEFDDDLVVNKLSDIMHKSMPYLIVINKLMFVIKRYDKEIYYGQDNKGRFSIFWPFSIQYKDVLIPDLINIEITIEYLNENKHILQSIIKVIHMLDLIENKITELQGYRFSLNGNDEVIIEPDDSDTELEFDDILNMKLIVENDELVITYEGVMKISASILENTGDYEFQDKRINLNYTYNLFRDIYYLIKDIITRILHTHPSIKSANN